MGVSRETVSRRLRPLGMMNAKGQPGRPARRPGAPAVVTNDLGSETGIQLSYPDLRIEIRMSRIPVVETE
jgi:hypothetical protein